jgi:predicted alpha/beta superfamily hydrolase
MKSINLILRYVFVGLLAIVFFVGCSTLVQRKAISPNQVQLKKIRVNDVTLNYIERGEGIPVVFVHGTLGDYRTWDGQVGPFSEKYRVFSYSRRYHYPNDWPQDDSSFSVTVHAKDLAAFIQALNVGPVHLVGHSFGAFISLLVAQDHPELLLSLTLGEPPVMPLLASTPEGESIIQDFIESTFVPASDAFEKGDDEEAVRQFINGVMGADNAFENIPSNIQTNMMDNIRDLKGELMDTNPFPPFSCEDARSVSAPTLLLHGELSPKMFTQTQDMLEQCMLNKERAMIPEASHGLEMENPEAFNETVLAFLEKTGVWEPFAGALANTQRRNLTSEITGRTYQISVALPEDYATSNETYPVLYAVDANTQFGTVVETAREQHNFGIFPKLIIVGIGYPVSTLDKIMALRDVDLSPTEDPGLLPEGSGGGPEFLDFIRRELIPLVELEFRANPADRALFGHSFGGLFALYALLEGQETFHRVIAASPSIGWDDRVIFQMESSYAESHKSLPVRLFLSSGLLEDNEEWGESASHVREMVVILESHNYIGLEIITAFFENETHISVIPAAISRGLRSVYEGSSGIESE